MSYLVDTNILSEAIKSKPDIRVVTWLREHEQNLFISTITLGEIRRGIELLDEGRRKTELREWLGRISDSMKGRILSFNVSVAHVWGQLKAQWEKEGVVIPSLDSQIAATAQRHGLIIVTRNVSDFQRTGIKLLNPFNA